MNPEALTKLNPQTSQIGTVGHSTAIGITSSDVAAACYKLDKVSNSLLSARINGDDQELKRLLRPTFKMVNGKIEKTNGLFSYVFNETLKLASERRWRCVDKGKDRLRTLTRIAIERVITTPVCRTCHGTKYTDSSICGGCGGSGQKRFDARMVSKELGIAESTYSENYRHKYNDIVCMIENIMHKAVNNICL